ncbi:MAG: pilus assembly protein [Alphaproteobacteria bacterium]|nr:pilus assembly protein [Alphaproteobacteria bacterium]
MEFAILGPVYFLLAVSTLEFGLQITVSALLESAARDASRFGVTGAALPEWLASDPNPPANREEAIRRIVLDRGAGMLTPTRLTITMTNFRDLSGLVNNQGGTAGAGGAGELVVYTMTYVQPYFTPVLPFITGQYQMTHTARSVVKNEPFPGS